MKCDESQTLQFIVPNRICMNINNMLLTRFIYVSFNKIKAFYICNLKSRMQWKMLISFNYYDGEVLLLDDKHIF